MTANLRTVHTLTTPCSLNPKKLLATPPGGTHSPEGTSPLWPPAPGKAIKLLFAISPKLCLCASMWHWCTEAALWHRKPHPKKGFKTWFLIESRTRFQWCVSPVTNPNRHNKRTGWHHVLLRRLGDSVIASTRFLPKTRHLRLITKKCRQT